MAPKYSVPRVWKRPYTSIYNDNYRYGNSLYSEAISDIERKYNEALARTRFRDRPDVNFQSFSDSQLVGESIVQRQRALATAAAANLDSDRIRSLSSSRAANYMSDDSLRRVQHSESFDTYQSQRALSNVRAELDESKLRRSRSTSRRSRRPESAYASVSAFEEALLNKDEGHSQAFWMERCRELQTEIENVNQLLTDSEEKIKHETSVIKNKVTQDVNDLLMAIDDQDKQIAELQKILRKQSKQISDVTLELEASQRHYTDVTETLAQNQRRCQNLVTEVEEIRSSVEKSRKSPPPSTRRTDWFNSNI
jgi:chromosome segregation ATPase